MSRIAALILVATLTLAGVGLPDAASGKRAKRATDRCLKHTRCAHVRRLVTRQARTERLRDLSLPFAPVPQDPQAPPPSDPLLPSFVSAAAREFSLTLSRPLVVRIELRNSGEDPHNLVVSPDGTHTPLVSFSTLDPGLYERHTVELAPGRYQLWCSLEGHETKGMSVTLRVQ